MTIVAIALGRSPGSKATLSTAQKAAHLWLAGKVDYVLMSGRWSFRCSSASKTTEAAGMKILAHTMGVPQNRILIDDWSRDTFSNMVGSRRTLLCHGIEPHELTLITIPHADRRAEYAAKMVFGNQLTIAVQVSDYSFSSSAEEARLIRDERQLFWATRLLLLFVRAGNLRAIQRRLQLAHPGYRASRTVNPIKLT